MLRPGYEPWWRRVLAQAVTRERVSPSELVRRCPECSTGYNQRDRYCPECKMATPEWRYG